MSEQSQFHVGDRVEHANGGRGRVTEIKPDGTVCVMFDGGKHWCGEYDRRWFELHPGWLVCIDR